MKTPSKQFEEDMIEFHPKIKELLDKGLMEVTERDTNGTPINFRITAKGSIVAHRK